MNRGLPVILLSVASLVLLKAGPTYADTTSQVATLLRERCATCHRPNGSAPFSLLTADEARRHATQIAAVTKRRYMPPWKVDPADGPFVGQKPLTDREIDLIQQWATNSHESTSHESTSHESTSPGSTSPGSTSPGSTSRESTSPRVPSPEPRASSSEPPAPDTWQLGKPDLVVTLGEPYQLQADGTDVFRIFVLPIPVDAERYVRGIEFRPGNARVVHHANIRIDRTPASRALDDADAGPGYSGLILRSAEYPDGHFLGWTPGQVAPLVPDDLAWRLAPHSDLVVEAHMQPSGRVEKVRPSIAFYFGERPPTRTPLMLRLGRQTIDIPAGEKRYVVSDSYVLPVDVDVLALQPHAHYRARTVRGDATLPDGTTKRLLSIEDWDFRWQHVYRYVTPLALPKGTRLSMEYVYDNSVDNVRNPERPPKRARWGQRSSDEMGDLWIQVLTRSPKDLVTLDTQFRRKVVAEDVNGYEAEIERHPADVGLRDTAAMLYLELGRPDDAARHFKASADARPESAAAHYNLATALSVARRIDAAIDEYTRALAIDPDYANAHHNLGQVMMAIGKHEDAIREFSAVVRLQPDSPAALGNLAAAHAAAREFDRAAELADAALRLKPAEPLASQLKEQRARYRRRADK